MPEDSGFAAARHTDSKRACDPCRARKIRCDKAVPCANCRLAVRTCVSTGFGQTNAGSRQRVLISTQYERKIDHIESRLDGIERLLRELAASRSGSGTCQHTAAAPSSPSANQGQDAVRNDAGRAVPLFEGESSLAAQATLATEFVERAVKRVPVPRLYPSLESALSTLRQIVKEHRQVSTSAQASFENQKPLPRGGLSGLPMPPLHVVLQMLREIKHTVPTSFSLFCSFITPEEFTDYCRKVYFATEDFGAAVFMIVNGGLYHLFTDKALGEDSEISTEFFGYRRSCAENLKTAIGSLSLIMPASTENITALLMGTNYAIEASRPSLAWRMSNIAAQMCQMLGYHRLPLPAEGIHPAANYKAHMNLFAVTYTHDKGLSLKLGRMSTFHDVDVVLPTRTPGGNPPNQWQRMTQTWIWHAHVKGKVYQQLYCLQALHAGSDQRARSAVALVEEVEAIMQRSRCIREELGSFTAQENSQLGSTTNQRRLDAVLASDMVSYHTTLTLIYRSSPPPGGPSLQSGTPNPQCVESARAAFRYHGESMRLLGGRVGAQATYIHWTLVFTPFAPLLVLFYHIIVSLDVEDLQILESFAVSIEPVCTVSESIEQLHRLGQGLHKVARLYVEAKTSDGPGEDSGMDLSESDFARYLDQLGVLAPLADPASLCENDAWQAQLDEWPAGGVNMNGLAEGNLAE